MNGLRIQARIIARPHLGLLAEEETSGSEVLGVHVHSDRRPLGKDGGHVR